MEMVLFSYDYDDDGQEDEEECGSRKRSKCGWFGDVLGTNQPTDHPWLGYQNSFDLLPDIRLFHGGCGRNLSNYLYGFWLSKTYFN